MHHAWYWDVYESLYDYVIQWVEALGHYKILWVKQSSFVVTVALKGVRKKRTVSAADKWVKIEKPCDEIKQWEISFILLLTQYLHRSQVRDFYYLLSPDIKETVGSFAFLISYYYRLSNILTCVLRRLKEKLIISVSCLFCGYWQSKPTK